MVEVGVDVTKASINLAAIDLHNKSIPLFKFCQRYEAKAATNLALLHHNWESCEKAEYIK